MILGPRVKTTRNHRTARAGAGAENKDLRGLEFYCAAHSTNAPCHTHAARARIWDIVATFIT